MASRHVTSPISNNRHGRRGCPPLYLAINIFLHDTTKPTRIVRQQKAHCHYVGSSWNLIKGWRDVLEKPWVTLESCTENNTPARVSYKVTPMGSVTQCEHVAFWSDGPDLIQCLYTNDGRGNESISSSRTSIASSSQLTDLHPDLFTIAIFA